MKVSMIWVTLLVLLLPGCDRWAEVVPGLYTPQPASREQIEMLTREPDQPTPWITSSGLEALFVDREHEVAWIIFADRSLKVVPFTPRAREAWPEGCPSNLNGTRMEVLDLDLKELTLPSGETSPTIRRPILVRDCPPDPVELVLRDAGDFGGGVACVGSQTCLTLEPSTSAFSLTGSTKGYELYSWTGQEAATIHYTLITGTNRQKTWDEVSASESVISQDGWVKITVDGEAALKSALDRLPEGEEVIWATSGIAPVPGHRIGLPDEEIVQEIAAYGQEQGLRLTTGN
jgi:hypothetical protein